MGNTQFWAGVITTLLLEGFGYFLYVQVMAAKRRKESREAYVPPAGSGLDRPIKDYPDKRVP